MDLSHALLGRRQIWASPSPTSAALPHKCSPFRLASGGVLNVGQGGIITLTQDAVFQPECQSTVMPGPPDPTTTSIQLSPLNLGPFYASTNPQIYALAAVTVVSYMLVIILLITPRSYFVAGGGGGAGFVSRRGIVGGAYGSSSVIGIGSRPWLQKLAAFAVAVALTMVTSKTLVWAERQYNEGYQDAGELSDEVMSGLEVRIVRIISETCLWLAQAQTLIRLFPRHKEKLVIKWSAFFLILLELTFSVLNHLITRSSKRTPRSYTDAVPALNYLFSLALNIAYAVFVMWYTMSKRRFAFWHPDMQSMPLVALLSLTAVFIPVIFFILDISQPDVSGWGNYVRWVGAAAASVVVWEWVERIEALERDEKRNGILGREIFDGDEMLEASDRNWPRSRGGDEKRNRPGGGFGESVSIGWKRMAKVTNRMKRSKSCHHLDSKRIDIEGSRGSTQGTTTTDTDIPVSPLYRRPLAHPTAAASPINRSNAASAASTVYFVRYHPVGGPTPPILESETESQGKHHKDAIHAELEDPPGNCNPRANTYRFPRFLNPFGRQRTTPPPEVAKVLANQSLANLGPANHLHQPGFLTRLHLRRAPPVNEAPRPVIVVPAPQRHRPAFEHSPKPDQSAQNTFQSVFTPSTVDGDERAPEVVINALNISRLTSPTSVEIDEDSHVHDDTIPHTSNEAPAATGQDEQANPAELHPGDDTTAVRTDHER